MLLDDALSSCSWRNTKEATRAPSLGNSRHQGRLRSVRLLGRLAAGGFVERIALILMIAALMSWRSPLSALSDSSKVSMTLNRKTCNDLHLGISEGYRRDPTAAYCSPRIRSELDGCTPE